MVVTIPQWPLHYSTSSFYHFRHRQVQFAGFGARPRHSAQPGLRRAAAGPRSDGCSAARRSPRWSHYGQGHDPAPQLGWKHRPNPAFSPCPTTVIPGGPGRRRRPRRARPVRSGAARSTTYKRAWQDRFLHRTAGFYPRLTSLLPALPSLLRNPPPLSTSITWEQ